MSRRKKGLLIQFFGLPNSGKSSRSRILYDDLKDQYEVNYMGNLGGFSLERIIEEPFLYYEFDLVDDDKKTYSDEDKIKENKSKLKDELKTYEEIFEKQTKKYLDKNQIVIGYNPIEQNIIHRFNIVEDDSLFIKDSLTKINKLHKPYNILNFYLDVTTDQIVDRQPNNYVSPSFKKILGEERRKIIVEEGYNSNIDHIKYEFVTRLEDIKNIYQTAEVLTYLDKIRNNLLDYSKDQREFLIQHNLHDKTQDEDINEFSNYLKEEKMFIMPNDISKETLDESINSITIKKIETIKGIYSMQERVERYFQPKSL